MPRFFLPASQVAGGRARLTGGDAAHLARSLRARPGETVVVVDDGGTEHGVRLDQVTPGLVGGTVLWSRPAGGEPRLRLTVLQALPQQGMDDAVSAMAAVGVAAVVPVVTRRTVVRPGQGRGAARAARWQALAREAASLALRGAVPRVTEPAPLDAAVAALGPGTRLLVADPAALLPLAALVVDPLRPCAVVIGPEGGLEPGEMERLEAAGAERLHLGARVLPARQAGAVVALLLLAAAGDLALGPAPAPPGG